MTRELARRLFAEFLGSAFLAIIVIGSGIAAQRLSPDDIGLELLENAAATAVGLFAIILMFGPVSGGHFNPVVSFVDATFGGLSWRVAGLYLPAQVGGCIGGAVLANLTFALPAVSFSTKHRAASGAHWLAEVVATVGLLLVIFALARTGRGKTAPAAVGAYIGGGVLLHQLDELRESGDRRRANVLEHLRRHRAVLCSWLRRRRDHRWRPRHRDDQDPLSVGHAAKQRTSSFPTSAHTMSRPDRTATERLHPPAATSSSARER